MEDFLRELKELLTKYNATIEVGYADCSDTHGMCDEHMEIYFTEKGSFRTTETFRINGWEIDSSDIKERLE